MIDKDSKWANHVFGSLVEFLTRRTRPHFWARVSSPIETWRSETGDCYPKSLDGLDLLSNTLPDAAAGSPEVEMYKQAA